MKKPQHVKDVKTIPFQYLHYITEKLELNLVKNFVYLTESLDLIKPPKLEKCYLQADQKKAYVFSEAIVGLQHRQPTIQLPCQDAVNAVLKPRPILVLCDGAGSATVSEIGAHALVAQLIRLTQTLEPLIAPCLDQKASFEGISFVRLFIRHAMGVLQDCAVKYKRSIQDFKSTLNFVVMGKEHFLWIKVGDGEIVQEKIYTQRNNDILHTEYQCLGTADKGEFANQTQFLDDRLQLSDVQWGISSTKNTTGIVLMSHGLSEKLVSTQQDQVAGQITQWLQQLRHEKFKVNEFYQRLYSEAFLNKSVGDDRSIALYSTGLKN